MPKRITSLTPAQIARFPEWRNKWIAHGLSTERADWSRFEKAVRECYRYANLKDDVPVIHVPSPMVGALAAPIAASLIALIRKDKHSTVYSAVGSAVESAVRSAVDSAVYSAVDSAVESAVRSAVGSAVGSAVDSAVRSAVGSAVESAIHSAVDSAVGSAVGSAEKVMFWHYWFGGSLWQAWNAFVTFFFDVCELDDPDIQRRANAYAETSLSAGYWWPNKDFIMVCDRPKQIKRNSNGQLHCTDDMAIKWPDGWGLWMLNGVRMREEQVIAPAEKITVEEVVKENNTEVRRELIRKIGIERFIQKAGAKVLDKKGNYELLSIRLSDEVPDARYLKMLNPSVGIWHVEGVEGNTVEQAINWRAGNIKEKWEPAVLT